MSRSTRFPAAIHILTLLAIKRGEHVSSDWIAKSLGTNAVVVRRIVGLLQQAEMVACQPGSRGGATLIIDPDQVTLRDIYEAVEDQSVFAMHNPHPKCPVACSVKDQVNRRIEKAEQTMLDDLAKTRLSGITKPAIRQYRAASK